MTNTHSLSTIFLWQGFIEQFQTFCPEHQDALSARFGGHVGLAYWVGSFAPLIDTYTEDDERDYPGCLAYEVVEPLGAWLATRAGDLFPESGEFQTKLASTITDWIDAANPKITYEVSAVRRDADKYVERCDEREVEMWAVYLRSNGGCAVWVADFLSRYDATAFAEQKNLAAV